ncbi:MAG: Spy/CpxP family protein refolding chaperone [Fuerstiella sp.]
MITSRFMQFSLTACLAAMFLTAVADAQPPEGGRGQGGRQRGGQRGSGFGGGAGGRGGFQPTVSKAMLLRLEDVLDELQIDESQGETIKAALDAYRQERDDSRPDRSSFEGKSDEERRALFEKMQQDREALVKKTDEIVVSLLEKDQAKRLEQISLQLKLRGGLAAALKSDDLQGKLSLTDEQVVKLEEAEKAAEEARNKMMEEMRASFQGGRGQGGEGQRPDFTAMREKMEAARKEADTAAMAVLTDSQKGTLEELKGKPFEVDMRALMQRGGRGGFGRGRGGDGGGGRGRGEGDAPRRRPASDTNDAI